MRAILFDLFETLITESGTRPPGVSSLAPELGCERAAFRIKWKAVRPAVILGRVSFRQALSDIATSLGSDVADATLEMMCARRVLADPHRLLARSRDSGRAPPYGFGMLNTGELRD